MGLRFRKSFNFGIFRINLSKSGIGYSVGIPGLRFTQLANGRQRRTLSVPGTGISWVEESSTRTTRKKSNTFQSNSEQFEDEIQSSDFSEEAKYKSQTNPIHYKPIDEEGVFKKIYKVKRLNLLFFIAYFVSLVLIGGSIFYNLNGCFKTLTLFFIFLIAFRLIFNKLFYVQLDYIMDKEVSIYYNNMMKILQSISSCQEISVVQKQFNTYNQKHYAGAQIASASEKAIIKKQTPHYIRTNIDVYMLKYGRTSLYFFPNILIVDYETKFSTISFGDIQWVFNKAPIAMMKAPSDTKVICYAWRHPNKNGGPDRRFSNNYEIPVCLYGEIFLSCYNGFNILFQFSQANLIETLKNTYEEVKKAIKVMKIFDNHRKALLPIANTPLTINSPIECNRCGHKNEPWNKYCVKCGNFLNYKKEYMKE